MKHLLTITLLLFALQLSGQTTITSTYVSGHWTLASSPYIINNNIIVNLGDTLRIDAGVEVVFHDTTSLNVSGSIKAVGTASQPITFRAFDTLGWSNSLTTNGGWGGIYIWINGGDTSSLFEYCNVKDVKTPVASNTINTAFSYFQPIHVRHCSFYHNKCFRVISISQNTSYQSSGRYEMDSCDIHDNKTFDCSVFINCFGNLLPVSSINIHGCRFYNNDSSTVILAGSYQNLLFEKNEVYQNYSDTGFATILIEGATSTIVRNNKIYNNGGISRAVLACSGGGNANINSNIICNNNITGNGNCGIIDGGAAIRIGTNTGNYDGSDYVVQNNILANNYTGRSGAGIYVWRTKAVIANNTVVHNVAFGGGKGIQIVGLQSIVTVKNNIFYGNVNLDTATWGSLFGESDVDIIADSLISFDNNWTEHPFSEELFCYGGHYYTLIGDSTNNINGANPGFVAPTLTTSITENALLADFSLLPTSVCIDKGDTSGTGIVATDYAANPRISGSKIDIGAYEYQPSADIKNNVRSQNNMFIYPNPASSVLHLNSKERANIKVVSMDGKLLLKKDNTFSIDISSLSNGVYMVQIYDAGGILIKVEKMVKE